MHFYYIHFKARDASGEWHEFGRECEADLPIEYATDLAELQDWCAKEVGSSYAMVLSWTLLKGQVRPGVTPVFQPHEKPLAAVSNG